MSIYDPASYDIRKAVPPLIARVRSAFLDALEERLAPFDIKPVDYIVLASLAHDVADTASAVCSIMSHDPGAMTRKIDALEQRGLVRRVRSSEDRRAIKLELTNEGRKLFPRILAVAVAVANDFLEGFSKTEVRQFEEMLQRVLDNAEELDLHVMPAKEVRR
ncbi:MAG TPA: MarR family transcriptional regulator [Usitatibacter sp.]|jgi:DNA-binding MarR family transcriptional regulator|nr:MarR family transcriptional regulator [Usitatibacter sp.]